MPLIGPFIISLLKKQNKIDEVCMFFFIFLDLIWRSMFNVRTFHMMGSIFMSRVNLIVSKPMD